MIALSFLELLKKHFGRELKVNQFNSPYI